MAEKEQVNSIVAMVCSVHEDGHGSEQSKQASKELRCGHAGCQHDHGVIVAHPYPLSTEFKNKPKF